MKRLILVAVLVCMVTPAWAADKNSFYQMWGAGSKSCGFWTKARKAGGIEAAMLSAWLNGFLTSYNYFTPGVVDVARGVDVEGRTAWVDNHWSYCQKLCMGLSCGGAILAFSIHEFDASNDLGELI